MRAPRGTPAGTSAPRSGLAAATAAFLSPVEHAIATQAAAVLAEAMALLENDTLPFGWEAAYTATGEKYYLECGLGCFSSFKLCWGVFFGLTGFSRGRSHTTQTTSWVHPNLRVAGAVAVETNRFAMSSSA